ncbi:MAG TPA: TIGR03617 family F420-dependent LLM class oxidoreductase [Pseudomonadales bacterium]|nr:TIGR03617 family F420-dependent LLM class oxidoreductase [Pseudomonadales bacterium]
MKIDTTMVLDNPAAAAALAQQLEAVGYDGIYSFEGQHDPFLPLALASQTTSTVQLGTGIAVAFARNPMSLAYLANDMQLLSQGRFILGLGTQIQAHIEKRYSSTWSQPAARLRDMVLAIRAIFSAWQTGDRLRYEGEFYKHTLMTPAFSPGANPYGIPPIYCGGFGPKMTEVVGEVADGFIAHPFHTPESIQQITLPALQRGFSKAGKNRKDFTLAVNLIIGTGDSEESLGEAREKIRRQIAFYGSTPAYRPVLDVHGMGELQTQLNILSKDGHWDAMAALVSDELLDAVAIVCPREEMAEKIRARCEGVFDRVNLVARYTPDAADWADVVCALKQLQ